MTDMMNETDFLPPTETPVTTYDPSGWHGDIATVSEA